MKARIAKAIILGGVISLTGVILSLIPFGPEMEKNEGLDILFKLRGKRTPPPDAVVVSIDKESAEFLNIPENPDKVAPFPPRQPDRKSGPGRGRGHSL